jgi:phage gp46-like protein
MTTRFEGDPKVTLGPDGSNLLYRGGQPEMDRGLENPVGISLFTRRGWFGNYLMKKPEEKIGSDFEKNNEQAITVSSLNENRMAAEKALEWMKKANIVSDILVNVTNPTGNSKKVSILLGPPNILLNLIYNGVNWQYQAADPAYLRTQ